MTDRIPVGEVRPSQLLWTYGPGALIDLPNLSVVTLGIDQWEKDRCEPIREPRLLAAVRKVLGPQVENLRMPPFQKSELVDPRSAEANIGVPVRPFPRWMRCVKCGLLSPFDTGLFEIKENRIRPKRTRFVHKGCRGSKGDQPAKDADAVPARFLLACRNGHLDDFPWHYFVHGGNSACKGTLRFFESGASLQTENLWVKCDACGASRSMAQAFGKAGKENLPSCRGRHPHLDHFDDDCDEEARAILLGSTNGWFPITLSALAIPQAKDPLDRLIQDGWEFFDDLDSEAAVAVTVKTLKKTGALPGIDKYSASAIWGAIEAHRHGAGYETVGEADIKGPEWDVLTATDPPADYLHSPFMSKKVATPAGFEKHIRRVLLLERLREVNALLGFTRVEAPEESSDPDERPRMAALARRKPNWVPANQVHGEGIFIQFDEEALQAWEALDGVRQVDRMLVAGHQGWRNSRHLDPNEGYPGIRYTMLHTLSHLLIRELALECGYNAASIRERIYADAENRRAGILIYTAAADSDGTLGGLVDLGKPENLGRLLRQALNRAKVCSSDPLCSEHDPGKDRSLHAAACHACSLVAETSCERGNRYLDRSLLVPTLERGSAAFFASL